jgi:hypothetical protein
MQRMGRAVTGLAIQAALWAFGIYLGVVPDALPGASTVARTGLATLFIAVGLLLGEVARLRAEHRALLGVLSPPRPDAVARDDRQAIDILLQALESPDAARRELAHRNLVRLTRQSFPAEAGPWQAWWREARATFPAKGGGAA